MKIWKECCHTVNRRLLCVVSMNERNSRLVHALPVCNIFSKNVEIRKFIPRSPDFFSTCAYETSFWLEFFFVTSKIHLYCLLRENSFEAKFVDVFGELLVSRFHFQLCSCFSVFGIGVTLL